MQVRELSRRRVVLDLGRGARLPVRTVLFGPGDPPTSGAAAALAALAAG